MPKDTKTLGNNKARACESLGFVHKKRLCQRFDTTSAFLLIYFSETTTKQGRRNQKREPFPGSDSTPICPPICSTIL